MRFPIWLGLWTLIIVRWVGKKLSLGFLLFIFSSCARTEFFYQGQRVASFQGDMARVHYTMSITTQGVTISWSADTVNHSVATVAEGDAIVKNVSAVVAGIPLILLPK